MCEQNKKKQYANEWRHILAFENTNYKFTFHENRYPMSRKLSSEWLMNIYSSCQEFFFSIVKLPLNYSLILFVLNSTSLKYSKNDTQAVNMHLKLVPCHCSATWTSSNKAMTQLKSNIKVQTDFSNEQSLFISKEPIERRLDFWEKNTFSPNYRNNLFAISLAKV